MWQTWFDMCDNPGICDRSDVFEIYYICDKRNVTYAANAMWLMWQVLPMRCYICDKCDVTYLTYMTYVTTRFDICDIYDICDICDVYDNSDVTYATNAMWVLWQMRSDICDIFDKCDICDKRNVTYMAYVDFRGWTLQENSLNWLEIFYLKCSFKWQQLLVKTTIIMLLSCVWLTAYTNWINNESVKSSPFSFNEYVWYDKLWGPSLRVVTLFSILKYSYIPTSLYYPYI